MTARTAHCGSILSFRADPGSQDSPNAFEYWERGALIVSGGRVVAVGPAEALLPGSLLPESPAPRPLSQGQGPQYPGSLRSVSVDDLTVVDHGDRLILPGFIDTHIHYAQTDIIASGGRDLLEWLRRYTFPAEERFADPEHASRVAEFFLDELLRNGTTTAQVLGTVHPGSADRFFRAAEARNLRMIAGKTLMDSHCPDGLRDTVSEGEKQVRELIEAWHGRARLHYAITPRFAATSSRAQLESAGRLAREYPDVFVHTHLAENRDEVAWVRELFPNSRSYLDVYDGYGLLRERATYAHCIYLDDEDRRRMAASGAGAAFCPSSNLYLGSGLFDLAASDRAGMRYSLATDVGGGSSFSMLRTMGEAYKVAQLQGVALTPLRAFYLSTLAGARMLGLGDKIGRFAPGTEADFIVLDPYATPLMARRMEQAGTLSERLLLWMILGDERAVAATFILGERV